MCNKFSRLVSIVIPVYNGSNYLGEAIDSALGQTYKNIEIIIINDGSNDGGKTREIALSYKDKIRYIEKENGGVASALNAAIREMKGEYFSWLSHDDEYYPYKIEKQVDYLNKHQNKLIALYSNFDLIDENSNIFRNVYLKHTPPERFRYSLIVSSPIHGCTLLIPKVFFERIGLFRTDLTTTQDYNLWFKFAYHYPFIHMPETLIKSRIHKKQGTKRLQPTIVEECSNMVIEFLKNISEEELRAGSKKSTGITYYLIRKSFKARGYVKAIELIDQKIVTLKCNQSVFEWIKDQIYIFLYKIHNKLIDIKNIVQKLFKE